MREKGIPIVVVDPLMPFMCGLSLSANGAGSEEQAYDYINAMLDTASGVALFERSGYGHGTANTVDLIDPVRVIGTGIDDPGRNICTRRVHLFAAAGEESQAVSSLVRSPGWPGLGR